MHTTANSTIIKILPKSFIRFGYSAWHRIAYDGHKKDTNDKLPTVYQRYKFYECKFQESMTAIFLEAIYDFPLNNLAVVPYVSARLGSVTHKVEFSAVDIAKF